jgi:hypothetical protein
VRLASLIEKKYLVYKGFASTSALLFAFIYSNSLGVVNRSIVTYIFVLSTLIWIVLSSGSSLTLRKIQPDFASDEMRSFLSLALVQTLIGILIFVLGLQIYTMTIVEIPKNLYFLSCVYFLVSGLALLLIEIQISRLGYVFAAKMEFLAVLSQFLIFEVMRRFFSLSISVSLLLGFIVSYSIISILLVKNLDYFLMRTLKLNNPVFFWRLTKGNHTVGVSIAILDRLDKIFIAYFFPIGALAPYSILCSLISTLRFIPDYASKLIISHNISSFSKFSRFRIPILAFSIPAFFLFAVSSQKFIVLVLGEEWTLPLSIGFFVAVQEFTRAFFQVQLNRLVLMERVLLKKYVPLFSVFLTILSVYLLANWVGLIGVPIAFSIVYGVTSVLTLLGGRMWSNP